MGTRSNICVYNEEKEEVIQSYCSYDSYYTNSGIMLQKHYNSAELAKQLVELGHISSIRPNLNPDPQFPHTDEQKQENVVFSFLRDYNSNSHITWDAKPVLKENVKSIFDIELNESYIYIYLIPKFGSELKEGWYAKRFSYKKPYETKLKPLSVIVKQAQNYDPK